MPSEAGREPEIPDCTKCWKFILQLPCEGRAQRPSKYSLTEVFCGAAAISNGFEACGHGTARFDCRISDDHNIHLPSGLLTLVDMMVHTKAGSGLVVFEPTCSSWGWVNLGTSLRSVAAFCGCVVLDPFMKKTL